MKKFLSMIVLFAILVTAVSACKKDDSEGATGNPTPSATFATTTTETTTVATTEEPEKFVSSEIFKDKKTDYVIVYDDSTREIRQFVRDLNTKLSAKFGVTLQTVAYDEKVDDGSPEIVVGNVRDIANKTYKKLTNEYDFAVKVEENKLVLCGKNALSYSYLLEYIVREILPKAENGGLTLTSDDNILYSDSELMSKNYIEYMRDEGKGVDIQTIFESAEIKNGGTTIPYRIYVPFNYTPEKEYPILINLHGSGHRGDDNSKHIGIIKPLFTNASLHVDDAIVICPQCPANNKWVDTDWGASSYTVSKVPESNELRTVVKLIEEIKEKYSVNEKRVYVCGFSMGGYGSWDLLMRHPDVFAAGVMMCSSADPTKANVLKDIPVWAIHGAKDPTVPVEGSRTITEAIKAAGGTKVKYTELPNNEHDVWTYTYSNTEIFTWLFSQEKQ